jgi:hypothetical protein
VQLLKEIITTIDVIDADCTSVVIQSKESELLMFPFVGGFEIEKATKVLDMCRGAGTALDENYLPGKKFKCCSYSKQHPIDGTPRSHCTNMTGKHYDMRCMGFILQGKGSRKILQKACILHSNKEHHNCKGNCSLLSRCDCKVAGRV